MELAIREAGEARILGATAAAAVTKPFGVKGMFYRVAGPGVRAIDGPTRGTIPPYDGHAKLGPEDPDGVPALDLGDGLLVRGRVDRVDIAADGAAVPVGASASLGEIRTTAS